ncbi:phosphotransferase family protein [Streptomyces rectiverticillatus]|uniref:phosphotransferase family protein n=1 Tax=Streptomyces rectiverticillatus TaxID=173860 RepID=UPI0015C34AE2|nr:aminoglycoside phosphotransferase family protein [Streptomyces rectiverticillatus]
MTRPTTQATARALRAAAEELGLTGGTLVGHGLEFDVWRMTHPHRGEVALRLPARAIDSNANDPYVETAELLRLEAEMYRYLRPRGIPVPEVYELLRYDVDVLVCEFLEADGSTYRSFALGELVGRLHELPPPAVLGPARSAEVFRATIAERVSRRWSVLCGLPTVREATTGSGLDLPPAPDPRTVASLIPTDCTPSLLHLDVRAANTLVRDGRIRALIDWSNSMAGDPALELARIEENARLPENRIEIDEFLSGYASVRPLPERTDDCWNLYRLDAAVMLAVVFTCEAPDARRGPAAVRRVHELSARTPALGHRP